MTTEVRSGGVGNRPSRERVGGYSWWQDRGIPSDELPRSAVEFAATARALAETQGMLPALQKVVETAVSNWPCTFAAAVADELTDRPARLAASTDEALARVVAVAAVEAEDSPGIRAFESGSVVSCSDLAEAETFRTYAQLMLERTAVRSVLAVPLQIDGSTVGVMTMYADQPRAFDGAGLARALVLGEHAAIALESAMLGGTPAVTQSDTAACRGS